jgi:hypothetical protein
MRVVAALATLGIALGTANQTTDEWYSMNKVGDNRYEGVGFRTQQSALGLLEMVSFIRFKDDFDRIRPRELIIDFFANKPVEDPVLARELIQIKQYRMEVLPPTPGWREGWNWFDKWFTADVIEPEKIPISKIAVLVRLNSDDPLRDHIAPVVLRAAGSRITGSLTDYEAHFVSSVPLDGSGSYEVSSGCGPDKAASIALRPIGTQRANVAFPIKFTLDASPGTYKLKIEVTPRPRKATAAAAGDTPRDPPVSREYCFPHQPYPVS